MRKIGYPCINRSLRCTSNATFRLNSYSEKKLIETVKKNIDCLWKILTFNVLHKLCFFRIGSSFIPFASHPICTFDWHNYFKKEFEKLGNYIKHHDIRIGMHPDQFILINAQNQSIVEKSIRELRYHCKLLDAFKLDCSAKVQIHVGGIYGNKKASIKRFISQYSRLPTYITKRLIIENDEYRYSLADCLAISEKTGIPVVLDILHHECLNEGESIMEALLLASKTWKKKDGLPIVDYSSQHPLKRRGSHADHLNSNLFKTFLKKIKTINFDLMFEIKDKEKSPLKAKKIIALKK